MFWMGVFQSIYYTLFMNGEEIFPNTKLIINKEQKRNIVIGDTIQPFQALSKESERYTKITVPNHNSGQNEIEKESPNQLPDKK